MNSRKDKTASKVYKEYESVKTKYSSFHDTAARIERLTLVDSDEVNNDGTRSKIYDPILYGHLMDRAARYSSSKPKGTYAPVEYGDMFKAKILNANFQFDWTKDKMQMKMPKLIKMSGCLGMAYGRNKYKVEKQKKDFDAVKTDGGVKHVKGTYTIHDGPSCDILNFYRVYPQPDAFGWDDMEYVIVEDWATIDELENTKDKGGSYKNLEKLKGEIKKVEEGDAQKDRQSYDNGHETLKELLQLDTRTGKFLMVTKYMKTKWISVAGGLTIRDIHNPYAHGELPIIPMYDDVWYDNVVSPSGFFFIEKLQRAANKLINMRFDNIEAIMSPTLRFGEDVDPTLVRIGGFRAIQAEEGDLGFFNMPDASGGTFSQAIGVLKDGIKTASAQQDFSTQASNINPANEFATGLRQQGDRDERRSQYHGMFIDDFIKRLADQWLSLTRQFAPTKKIVRIAGRDMVDYFRKNAMIDIDEGSRAITPQEAIAEGRGGLVESLGLAYETGEGEYEPRIRYSSDDMFGWIRLTPADYQGNYDFIPETESTVSADRALDRNLKLSFFKVLMEIVELIKAGFLTEKAIYDLAEQFGFKNSESMFNFENIQMIISSQQAGYTGQAGPTGGQMSEAETQTPVPGATPRGRGFPAKPSNLALQ